MPRPVSWLPRLHEIRRSVSSSVRSHFGRRDLELLFRLQPRAAGALLEILPTMVVGTALLVEREALGRFLAQVLDAEDVGALFVRLRADKEAGSRQKPRKLVLEDVEPLALAALPDWMELSPGRLVIRFTGGEQLCEGLLLMARILDSDYDEFVRLYRPEMPIDRQRELEREDVRKLLEELNHMEGSRG